MATESVKLVVGAEDRASKVLGGIGSAVTSVEEKVGGLAKASSRGGLDLQSMISELAGEELNDFANQVSTLKDQLERFNAANVKGAKGLGLMKVGLVTAVAVGGFKFGQWLIGARQLNEDFARSLKESQDAIQDVSAAAARLSSSNQFELTLIKDPDEKRAKIKQLLETAEKNLQGTANMAKLADQNLEKMNTTFKSWTGNKLLELTKEQAKQATEALKEKRKVTQELQDQLNRFNLAEAARVQVEREAAEKTRTDAITELIGKMREEASTIGLTSDELEIYRLKQLRAGEAAIITARTIQAERKKARDAEAAAAQQTKNQQDASDQRAAAIKSAKQQADALAKTEKGILDGLRQQLLALTEGEAAAARYKEKMQGIGSETSKQAQLLRDQISAIKERNKLEEQAKALVEKNKSALDKFVEKYRNLMKMKSEKLIDVETFKKAGAELRRQLADGLKKENPASGAGSPTTDLQAKESRFLSGAGSDTATQQVEAAKKSADMLTRIDNWMERNNKFLETIAKKNPKEVEVVG